MWEIIEKDIAENFEYVECLLGMSDSYVENNNIESRVVNCEEYEGVSIYTMCRKHPNGKSEFWEKHVTTDEDNKSDNYSSVVRFDGNNIFYYSVTDESVMDICVETQTEVYEARAMRISGTPIIILKNEPMKKSNKDMSIKLKGER
ncbi:MAG: hypothetical protein ACRCX2_21645 [Paraclostridium sp.]